LCLIVVTALSGIATDVEVSIHEIQTLLDEEDKQEKEFQVNIRLFEYCQYHIQLTHSIVASLYKHSDSDLHKLL